ncbi:wax ester/triacylglycerol synthase domain-containing protein [Streptomyces sp. NRRL F-5755]|uniref:wax ester/triacylglycerol synthase domain-containing protein n=1 Tax=Streptomyces sp. NRRL F-5755 TaxID=1519475 RepID=UPI000ACD7511|nr:wax ester/triacylglycerol synthase domain-containing protein [Streptomyces sp. NRRL F-5755]
MNSPPPPCASALDRAFLAFGAGAPDARLDVGAVVYVEGRAPTLSDLMNLIGGALHLLPVLSHELCAAGTTAAWLPARDFEVGRHVVETVVPGEGRSDVLDAARQLWAERLTRGSAWELRLLRPSSGDGWGLSYRVHHSRQDGVAIGQTLQTLFAPAGPGPVPRPAADAGTGSRTGRALRAVGTAVALYAGYRRFPPTGLGTPWELSGRRQVSTAAASLPRLRTVAHTVGGTVNDVHLAALAGAVRAWLLEAGRTPGPLAVAVPLSVRLPEESTTWGNRCFLRRVWLPCQESDPRRRLVRTVAAGAGLKSARVRRTAQDLLHRAPDRLVRFALHRMLDPRYAPVIASYVPCGEDEEAVPPTLTDVLPMTLLPPGHPFNVCLTTYGSTAQIAMISDASVPGADRLPELWRRETAALCGGPVS